MVAININSSEDCYVGPLMKNNQYDFLPLKGMKEVVDAYGVNGTPANFLIGPDGRIYFKPYLYDEDTARMLEMEIDLLLHHRSGSAPRK